jgi:DNA-binding NarL/FixJ family response regulator
MGGDPANLLLVDDHPLFHAGLRSVLHTQRPQYSLLSAGDAATGLELIASRGDIDLVLIDIVLPGEDGFAAVARYGREAPTVPLVLISGREDPATVGRARRSGASGFIAKSWPPAALLHVIDEVLKGGSAFEPPPDAGDDARSLTLRQLEVLSLLAQGKSNKDIGWRLGIADRTVRAHLTEVFQAVGASSRVQAVLSAQRLGLVD